MKSHIHLILSIEENNKLSNAIRDLKSFTSRKIRFELSNYESSKEFLLWMMKRSGDKNKRNASFQLLQQNNHPIELSTNEMQDQRLNYIHQNPVEAGFVTDASSWKWSSCASYENDEVNMIDLCYIE